jgi:SPP1 gp7 family putative phage head morphogenesis protein
LNKWEKEVQQSLLDSEEAAIKELEKQYSRALKDINDKVKSFQADIDLLDQALSQDGLDDATKALLQSQKRSKVYQQNYQKALKGQVSGVLDKLHGDNYATIDKYLKSCYETGYIGTMYDIAKQGVPIIAPIDQAAAVKAILTDSKIVEGYYNHLGVNYDKLKKTITQEISRGIASGLPYSDIARNINNVSSSGLYNAKRIARTEGHRIQQTSSRDAQYAAKKKGCDVVKQWDSTLDGRTRDSHARVDGEIRELDEKFSNGLMFPGDPSGRAAEVINCRCTSNTRARWALDDGELQTLKERAEYFGLDKTKNFEEYKEKYLTAADKVAAQKPDVSATTQKLSASMDKADYEEYRKLVEGNPDIAKLYSKADQISNISASASNGYYQPSSNSLVYSYPQQRYIDNGMSKYETLAHEYGHFFDVMVKYSTTSYKEADALNAVCKYSKIKKAASTSDEFLSAMRADKKYIKSILTAEVRADLKAHDASCGVQDAIDGLFGVRIGWGHGDKYYNRKYSHMKQLGDEKAAKGAYLALGMDASNQAKVQAIVRNYETASELWANMMSAETTGGEALEYIKKFFPETYKTFVEIIKGAL